MKGAYNLGTPKSSAEAIRISAKTAQNLCRMVECTIVGEISTARHLTRQEARKHVKNIRKNPTSRIK